MHINNSLSVIVYSLIRFSVCLVQMNCLLSALYIYANDFFLVADVNVSDKIDSFHVLFL